MGDFDFLYHSINIVILVTRKISDSICSNNKNAETAICGLQPLFHVMLLEKGNSLFWVLFGNFPMLESFGDFWYVKE